MSADGVAGDLARGAVDAAGDVAGDDDRLSGVGVDRLNRGPGRFPRLAGETGAEDGVDDDARPAQRTC